MDPRYQNGIPQLPSAPQPQAPASPPPISFVAAPAPRRPLKLIVAVIILALFAIGFGAVAIWAYMNYLDQKSDVDARIEQATARAVKDQKEKDAIDKNNALKAPLKKFNGPADYGGLSFLYPKTWSAHVAKDASDGNNYEAYLNKDVVPPVSVKQQFALRVIISNIDYDRVVKTYDARIKKGDLKSTPIKVNEQNGLRFDGMFTKDLQGSAVVYKIRDKTLTMQTDINTGEVKDDFEALIKTIMFNT